MWMSERWTIRMEVSSRAPRQDRSDAGILLRRRHDDPKCVRDHPNLDGRLADHLAVALHGEWPVRAHRDGSLGGQVLDVAILPVPSEQDTHAHAQVVHKRPGPKDADVDAPIVDSDI